MKPIKFIFSSLFSNKTIIDESKKQPWWLAIVLIILSFVISVIPSFSNVMSTNGSDALVASNNCNIDFSLKKFSQDYLGNDNYNFIIEDGKLKVTNFTNVEIKYNEDITLLVYYIDYTDTDKLMYDSFESKVSAELTKIKVSHPTEEHRSKLYSTLILGEQSVYLYLYGKDAICTYSPNADGTFNISEETSVINQIAGTYENITGDLANISGYLYGSTEDEKLENAYNKWKSFFDEAYKTPRNQTAFIYSASFLGIDVLILFSMSLLVFLLSKSKSSPRKFKYLESLKMLCFASLCPALIGLLLGLIIPSFQTMSFVMCYILRITWLSMKATSPGESNTATRK